MTTLVFSYSHADEALRNELEKHLSPLKRMGKITTWHDRCIIPGQEFENQIDHYFSQANIILLLVSSDFIASDYCYQVEMANALERHKRGEAVVIPVILRECAWHQLPFGSIMAATIDGKPIPCFSALLYSVPLHTPLSRTSNGGTGSVTSVRWSLKSIPKTTQVKCSH